MRIRRGSRTYFVENIRGPESDVGPISDQFLAATLNTTPLDGRPREPSSTELTFRFPCSWTPNEIHFAGAGVETSDGDLVHTGTVLWRGRVIIGTVPVLPTALTVTGPGRLLLGTGDGRILECVDLERSSDVVHSGDCGRR